MAIALVPAANATGHGQNGTGAMVINSTGGNFLLGCFGWYAGITADLAGLVDSKGGTYAQGTKYTTGVPSSVRILYSDQASPTVGSGHSLTITAANLFVAGSFSAWSGVNSGASVFDQETGKTAAGTASITLDPLTPSEDNCLVVTALMFDDNASGTVSINGAFIPLDTVAWNSGGNEGLAVAYWIQTTAQVASPTWNVTNSDSALAATMAIFKGPGGGGVSDILMGQAML